MREPGYPESAWPGTAIEVAVSNGFLHEAMNVMDDAFKDLIEEAQRERQLLSRKAMTAPAGKAGEIAADLERRLILGYFKTGEGLSFKKLADMFQVSRQPVSSALGHLRALGYVEVLPQVGCRVVQPSREEILDFFRVHSAIEALAVEMAVERKTPQEEARLLAIKPPPTEQLDSLSPRMAYIDYIDAFHDQIWAMAKAPLLEGKFSGLRNLASFYLWQGISSLAPKVAAKLNDQRGEIADLIVAGDKKGASRLMQRHVIGKPEMVFP